MAEIKCPSCGASIPVPDKKTGLWWGLGCLIAVIAIPFLVAVIGVIAAIAIPSFAKARDAAQHHVCAANLQQLEAAKRFVAQERGSKQGDALSEQEVLQRLGAGGAALTCPNGGRYTVNPVGKDPACSVHGPLSNVRDPRTGRPLRRPRAVVKEPEPQLER